MDACALLVELAAAHGGVVTAGRAVAAGLARGELERLCRAGLVRRLARGAFLVDQAVDLRRARIRAVVASFGPAATVVLDTAAEIHGIAGLRPAGRVHICVPTDRPRKQRTADPDVVVHQLVLRPTDVAVVDGLRVTSPTRTVADVILRSGRYESVCVLDSALNGQVISEDDVDRVRELLRGRRGAVRARQHLVETDGRARSPLETRVRLRCVDGDVAPDEVGYLVRDDDGHVLAEGDLAWVRAKVIGEADGAGPHQSPEALYGDRRRQNRLVEAGWLVLRFTWADTLRPGYIPDVVRSAIARRRRYSRPG